MYIAPNSVCKLLADVPLDLSLSNTINFSSREAQEQYFNSKCPNASYSFSKLSYTRYKGNVIRLNILADKLYNCNYLMFQNTSYGNKWFYAFIVNVEYLNNTTSQITYVIDPMQTWLFDYTLRESFVVREHAVNDYPGSNLIQEGLELGDYVCDDYDFPKYRGKPFNTFALDIGILAPFDATYHDYAPGQFSNLVSGLALTILPHSGNNTIGCEGQQAKALYDFIDGAKVKAPSIVSVFTYPMVFQPGEGVEVYKTLTMPKNTSSLGGYIPRNKKLFTSPYNFLAVSDCNGKVGAYPYEYFSSDDCEFEAYCPIEPNPTITYTPRHFRGANWNLDEKFTVSGFPILPWTSDAYMAQLAQQATMIPSSALTAGVGALMFPRKAKQYTEGAFDNPKTGDYLGLISDVATAATGRLPGRLGTGTPLETINDLAELKDNAVLAGKVALGTGATLGTSNLGQTATEMILEAVAPQYAHPLNSCGTISGFNLASQGKVNMIYTCKHIRPEYAKIIDDYFDMYGYATNQVKVPNTDSRPHWNYVKTINCNAIGSIPADQLNQIMACFDRGITFWKNPNEIGDYSLDNRP